MDISHVKVGESYVWYRNKKGTTQSCELIEIRALGKTKKTVRVEYREKGETRTYYVPSERIEKLRN